MKRMFSSSGKDFSGLDTLGEPVSKYRNKCVQVCLDVALAGGIVPSLCLAAPPPAPAEAQRAVVDKYCVPENYYASLAPISPLERA